MNPKVALARLLVASAIRGGAPAENSPLRDIGLSDPGLDGNHGVGLKRRRVRRIGIEEAGSRTRRRGSVRGAGPEKTGLAVFVIRGFAQINGLALSCDFGPEDKDFGLCGQAVFPQRATGHTASQAIGGIL